MAEDTVSVSRTIAAPAEELWSLIADITRMGEWSPETTGASWIKGADGPVKGARFRGNNTHGKKSWSTVCEIVDCEPGKTFAFDATAGPIRYAQWRYEFEPTDGGTVVTETWTDRRGPIFKYTGKFISGVADRATHNKATMTATLEALDAAAGQG